MKGHLKTLPPNERHKVKNFERLRNLADGLDPNEGMDEIDRVSTENWKRRNTTTTGKSYFKQALREKKQPQPDN